MSETRYAILEKLYEGTSEKGLIKAYNDCQLDIGSIEEGIQKLSEYSRAVFALLADLQNQRNLLTFIAMQLTARYGYHTPAEIIDGKPDVKSVKEK